MDIDFATAQFVEQAREFCRWVEGPPGSHHEEAHTARLHLARLYARALELSPSASWNGDAPEISQEDWKRVFKRFGALPVNYYGECLDPLEVPASETCLGDLADDLADIWRDVKTGLVIFDTGDIDGAVYEWREHFIIHWSEHATSALYILQRWIRNNRRWETE